ncbi:hypothetical protein FSPOR_5924 [Fusarium sporotrichioides]|uniref:Uncharacterized protein n=1 Tax=Fusarium sporotrichioides TaxID=5514 RepID=A0A395S5S2_FUSSP|nr:hypothetical protein FSPOR_5924 [Fusarium sporotrichioides]
MLSSLHVRIIPETHPKPTRHSYELTSVHDTDTESTEPTLIPKPPETKESAKNGTFSQHEWGLEILSASVSFLLFIGMIVIFWTMQDEPVSKWSFPISINATIAILSTACTAAMMHNVSAFIGQLKWLYLNIKPRQLYTVQRFDEASRGPYGSILFLLKVSWNMATLGALITILRLGFAPMAQEVISLEPRPVNTTDKNATFGFAHTYDRNLSMGHNSERPPDPHMQAAIIKGLYDINTAPPFNCSGLCEWKDRYVSLGFKSVCENVTVSTLNTKSCVYDSGKPVTKDPPGRPPYEYRTCNMTTPGGIILSIQQDPPYFLTAFRSNTTLPEDTSVFVLRSTKLMRFAIYRTGRDETYMPLDTDITECTLSYAAYEYTGARANGSVFSFDNTQMVDLEWNGHTDLEIRRLVSSPTKDGIPELYFDWIDELALRLSTVADLSAGVCRRSF